MRQTRASKRGQNRTKRNVRTRQSVQNRAANRAANRQPIENSPLSLADAARLLGTDRRSVRRFIDAGTLHAYQTPGGHWRIPRDGINAIQSGGLGAAPIATLASQPSTAAAAKARVEDINAEIAERRARKTLRELQREESEEKEAAQSEQEESRRLNDEARCEREQRQREQRKIQHEARIRKEWEAEQIERAAGSVRDVPDAIVLEVTHAVRQKLSELWDCPEDVAERCVLAIAERIARPWRRSKEAWEIAGYAAREGLNIFTPNEWRSRAQEQALAAINALPENATRQNMVAAASKAVKETDAEYQHAEKTRWALSAFQNALPALLPHATARDRSAADDAVRQAFEGLPVGASDSAFDAARVEALTPFLAAEKEAKKTERTELYLARVDSYLAELERASDGWDFEGERAQYAEKIKRAVRADLLAELPADIIAGYRRVEELTTRWLDQHAQSVSN